MKFNPQGSQFDPTHPPLEKTLSPEEAAAYLERQEDLLLMHKMFRHEGGGKDASNLTGHKARADDLDEWKAETVGTTIAMRST